MNYDCVKFIYNNILLGIIVNFFVAPIAYIFRKRAQRKHNFLWTFLSDDNMYGDKNWRPKLKNRFLRAVLWMYRNPRQNWYWKDWVQGVEYNFRGYAKVKFGRDAKSWRTMRCADTGDWHGKVLDFMVSPFGHQNITFERTDIYGNVQQCYRKSKCIPRKFLWWIILFKSRSGHEHGLMQYNYTLPVFNYKLNKEGWKLWKETEWKTITL